jgi:hypothetical protein
VAKSCKNRLAFPVPSPMSADPEIDETEVRRILRASLVVAGCGGGVYIQIGSWSRSPASSRSFLDFCWARLSASAEEQKKLEQAEPLALELSWAAVAAIWYLDPSADARAATIDREALGGLLDDPLRFLCDALAHRVEADVRWAVFGPPPYGAVRC